MYLPFYSNTKFEINFGFRLYVCVCIDLILFSAVAFILKGRCNVFLSTYTIRYVSVVIPLGKTWTCICTQERCCSLHLE